MGFVARPLLGKVRSFNFSGATGGFVQLDPTLAGISAPEWLQDWERRVWWAIMTPGGSLAISFVDPATAPPGSYHMIQVPDVYHEYFVGGDVWINNDFSADDVHVVFGY